jgi:hypothetical protein
MPATDLDTLFGDVRAALDAPHTPRAWDALCDVLATAPASDAFSEQLAPYLRERLDAWPEHIRLAPTPWLRQSELSARAHLLGFARHVRFTHAKITSRGVRRILAAWGDQPITFLDLEDCRNLGSAGVIAIVESPHAATIRHLNLNLCGVRADGFRALAGLSAPLDYVDLSYNSAPDGALGPWIRSGSLAQARYVHFNHCDLSSQDVLDLCALLSRGRVATLELRGATLTFPHAQRLAALPWHDSPLVTLDLGLLDAPPRALELLRHAPNLKGKVVL